MHRAGTDGWQRFSRDLQWWSTLDARVQGVEKPTEGHVQETQHVSKAKEKVSARAPPWGRFALERREMWCCKGVRKLLGNLEKGNTDDSHVGSQWACTGDTFEYHRGNIKLDQEL